MFVLLLALFIPAQGIVTPERMFDTLFSWRQIDFEFPNETIRKSFVESGHFTQENNMPLGVSVWRDRMFITVPRWKSGVPFNLNYVLLDSNDTSPILKPYPSFESNDARKRDGDAIVSIFRTRVDACDRLWGIDTGIDDILGDLTVVRPTRLVVIDLKTDQIIRSYTLKDSDQKPDSFFADLAVDVDEKSCDDAYAYLSDLGGYGIVTYSWVKNDSWRATHNYFYFDPLHGDYNISGFNFQWTDGVFGMALSPKKDQEGFRDLYFHAMSGITEFRVSTRVLRDPSVATNPNNYHFFKVAGVKGPKAQGTSSAMDPETGIEYLSQVHLNGVGCWDTNGPLNPDNFVLIAQDNRTMVFPNDLTVDASTRKLYVLSDNLPKFHYGSLDPADFNYFVTVAPLDDLARDCKAKSPSA